MQYETVKAYATGTGTGEVVTADMKTKITPGVAKAKSIVKASGGDKVEADAKTSICLDDKCRSR